MTLIMVRNLPDGRVEVMACGEAAQLKHLQEWLKRGPELAKVMNLESEKIACQEFDGFMIL